jgi:hypothetical protein
MKVYQEANPHNPRSTPALKNRPITLPPLPTNSNPPQTLKIKEEIKSEPGVLLLEPLHLSPRQLPEASADLVKDLRTINIKLLVDTIKPIIEHPRPCTPLLIDPTDRVNIFFTYSGDYSGLFVDAKKILVQTMIRKEITTDEALEELRCILVNAMKHGRTLVVCMGDSATDFLHKFHGDNTFPVQDLFVRAGLFTSNLTKGQLFKQPEYWAKVVRESDMEYGTFVVRPEFSVVITTAFQLEDYQEFLKNAIPIQECIPIYILPALTRLPQGPQQLLQGYSA